MFLIDTDIIIYSLKGDQRVLENLRSHAKSPKAISMISYAELLYGARNSNRIQENLAKVYRVRETFPILELGQDVMEVFAELKVNLRKEGTTVAEFDLLIAATALSYGYSIVTNNEKHFNKIPNLRIVNWSQ